MLSQGWGLWDPKDAWCLPAPSALRQFPFATNLRDFTPGRLWSFWSPGGAWSWLGNEKGNRVGSWKANRARRVDTHARGHRYKDRQRKCPHNGICGHTQTQTQRNRARHTTVTGNMQKSRGILRCPDTQTPRDTCRYTQTHKGYMDIHTSTAM